MPDIREIVRDANRSEIARSTGISLSHISRVLGGSRMPSSAKLRAIAQHLDVDMDQLFDYLADIHDRRSTTKRKVRRVRGGVRPMRPLQVHAQVQAGV